MLKSPVLMLTKTHLIGLTKNLELEWVRPFADLMHYQISDHLVMFGFSQVVSDYPGAAPTEIIFANSAEAQDALSTIKEVKQSQEF